MNCVQTKLIMYLPKAETFSRAGIKLVWKPGNGNHSVGSTVQGTEPQQMERNAVALCSQIFTSGRKKNQSLWTVIDLHCRPHTSDIIQSVIPVCDRLPEKPNPSTPATNYNHKCKDSLYNGAKECRKTRSSRQRNIRVLHICCCWICKMVCFIRWQVWAVCGGLS